MTSKVLLDANFLIYTLEPKSEQLEESEKKQRLQALEQSALQRFEELLAGDAQFFITPLIQYEVLCGASNNAQRQQLQSDMNAVCEMLQINETIAHLAATLFRTDCNLKNVDKKKHRFDLLHFATAKHYDLELATVDRDFASLETAWQQCHQTMESSE